MISIDKRNKRTIKTLKDIAVTMASENPINRKWFTVLGEFIETLEREEQEDNFHRLKRIDLKGTSKKRKD